MPIIRTVYRGCVAAKCASCGVAFLSPPPDVEHAEEIYDEDYYNSYSARGIPMPAGVTTPPKRCIDRLELVRRSRGTGTLLDIGPGTGAFLNHASGAGWSVVGLEASRYAAARATLQYGIDVRCGTLQTVDLGDERFDVIHMSHVLEHFSDPVASLTVVHKWLRPGGFLIIEVPNEFENLQFRVLKRLGMLQPYPVESTHVFFFTPSALRSLLTRVGFTVTRLRTFRDVETASGLGRAVRKALSGVESRLKVAPLIEAVAIK
jgi:2-polyprenyl-3-methyl-5-hydroxy-6-metoxy-1,4-benzoquinol methylase